MNRLLILVMLLLVVILSSCKGAGVAGECAGTSSVQCLTERKCSYDSGRNCMVCQCADPGMPRFPLDQDGRLPAPSEGR